MTSEQLLDKWQALDLDDREKVLAFIDLLYRQKQPKKSTSSLGKFAKKSLILGFLC